MGFVLLMFPCIYGAQAQAPVTGQLNTGTNGNGGVLPTGSYDLHWQYALGSITGSYSPAIVMSQYPSYYVSQWPDAQWISYSLSGDHGSRMEIFFKTSFDLSPCGGATPSLCLALDFYADNCVFEIYVNGVPQSGPNTFLPPADPYNHYGFMDGRSVSVNLCNDWIVGTNELIVHVKSDPNNVGFLCQTSVAFTPPPPPDLSIATSGGELSCAAPQVVLTAFSATPNVIYNWETGSTTNTTTVTAPGYYTVTVFDTANGCEGTIDSVYVGGSTTPPDVQIAPPDTLKCSTTDVDLSASSSIPGVLYYWNTGDSAATTNVTVPGTYFVTVTDTANGCSSADSVIVTANGEPIAAFIAPSGQCINDNNFTFTGGGSNLSNPSFSWNFENGTPATSTQQHPTGVEFSTPGKSAVTLTVTDGGCVSVHTDTVTLFPMPVATFTPPARQCIGNNSFSFAGSGSNLSNPSYNWIFENGTPATSTQQNPTGIVFSSTGRSAVTVSVIDNGCASSYTDSITVVAMPVAIFTPPAGQCINDNNFSFAGSGSNLFNPAFSWIFENGTPATSTQQHPTGVEFSTAGKSAVTLTVTDNGCVSEYTDSITVVAMPVAIFTPPAGQCINDNSFSFAEGGSASSNPTFSWSFEHGNPTTSTQQNPTGVEFSTVGKSAVTLTITDNGCVSEYTDSITVTAMPVAIFIPPAGQCINDNSFSFLEGGSTSSNPTFSWSFEHGNPFTSSQQNPTGIEFSTTGKSAVTLTITDNGCVGVYADSITVFATPVVDFTADTLMGCGGSLTVNFTPTAPQPTGASWAWDFGDGENSSLQNPSHTFSDAGVYDISLTVTTAENCGASFSQTGLIQVVEKPIADFSPDRLISTLPDAVINFTNESQFATAYLWNFADGDSSTAENLSQIYIREGVYTVTLHAFNSGCEDEITKTVTIERGEPQFVYIPSAFSPNGDGKNDFFRVILENAELEQLTIFNRWGEKVFETGNINEPWDGSYQGVVQPIGVFAYTATARFSNSKKTYSGSITLVK